MSVVFKSSKGSWYTVVDDKVYTVYLKFEPADTKQTVKGQSYVLRALTEKTSKSGNKYYIAD